MVKKTELYERHVALGARMITFAGWALPVQYSAGPKAEHLHVREAVGLFDIDHMGQIVVTGPDAVPYLQRILTADVNGFSVGRANYSMMCYQDGGIVDDVFVYHMPDRYFITVNAANNAKDTSWMNYHRDDFDVKIENVSEETYMLALQGPLSQSALQGLCAYDLDELAYHEAVDTKVAGVATLLGRTGYTGEDGFELYFPVTRAAHIWDTLMEDGKEYGILPIGLAARDSLRLEPCMPLYGHEISPTITPIEADMAWTVSLDKENLIGRQALLKTRLEGPSQKLVAFEMTQKGVPRHDYAIYVDDTACGHVTSGIYSPTLEKFIGMAYVSSEYSSVGQEIGIEIRGTIKSAVIVKKPFYTPAYRR
ncbi:MAG: glycine cleavage system aminomethyltransferase GcvT [Anaerolineales bacterium]